MNLLTNSPSDEFRPNRRNYNSDEDYMKAVVQAEIADALSPKVSMWVMDETKPVLITRTQTEGSFGFDVMINDDMYIYSDDTYTINTNVAFRCNSPFVAPIILPRSGRGCEGLVIANTIGLVDSDYFGPVKVVLLNRNRIKGISLRKGERVAQIAFTVMARPKLVVDYTDNWHPARYVMEHAERSNTVGKERGAGGFGSTDPKPQQQGEISEEKLNSPIPQDSSDPDETLS